MYVITNHNEQNFVILGPIAWNPRFISSVLSAELDEKIIVTESMRSSVPFEVFPGVMIRECNTTYEEINPRIESHNGPFWTYNEDDTATGAFVKVEKPVNLVKQELINLVSGERYIKENAGTNVTIQDTEVFVSTDRSDRNVFAQRYTVLAENEVVAWKFSDTWLNLTKEDFNVIITAINSHIQSAFDWELQKITEINECETLTQLNEFTIEEAPIE